VLENEEIELIKTVGEKIRQKRTELNLSQELLSYDANIPRNQIGRIERGEISTSITTLHKICKALKIEIKDLF
jgi:transcriptional regulator with XRE-family HTH domain